MNNYINVFDSTAVESASPEVILGETTDAHPYARHVNPHLAELLAKLRLDKCFVRGEGCELYRRRGAPIPGLHRRLWGPAVRPQPSRDLACPGRGRRPRGEPSFVQPSLLDAAGQLAARLVEIAPEGSAG